MDFDLSSRRQSVTSPHSHSKSTNSNHQSIGKSSNDKSAATSDSTVPASPSAATLASAIDYHVPPTEEKLVSESNEEAPYEIDAPDSARWPSDGAKHDPYPYASTFDPNDQPSHSVDHRVTTSDTIAAARVRQARKDEFARAYERDNGNIDHPNSTRSNKKTPRLKRPEFTNTFFAVKTPMSKKLQQQQRELELYNNTPRTVSAKKSIKRVVKPTFTQDQHSHNDRLNHSEPQSNHVDGDLSDEEAALARLDGIGAKSSLAKSRPITSSTNAKLAARIDEQLPLVDDEPPLEYEEDSPWLDSLTNSGAVIQGGTGLTNSSHHPTRGHRASVIFREHEPSTQMDVEQLSATMRQLFELQRTGSGGGTQTQPTHPQPLKSTRTPSTAKRSPSAASSSLQVDQARQAAERARHALAAALASLRQKEEQAAATQAAAAAGTPLPKQSPTNNEVSHHAETPVSFPSDSATGSNRPPGTSTPPDTKSFAQMDEATRRQFQSHLMNRLSPEEYYAEQLAKQEEEIVNAKAAAQAADEERQRAEAELAEHEQMEADEAEYESSPYPPASNQYAPSPQVDPFGFYANSPGAGLYLEHMASVVDNHDRWNDVPSHPRSWGAALPPPSKSSGVGQYARSIKPGRYSVEAKLEKAARQRARTHARKVAQLQAQLALQTGNAAAYPHPTLQHHAELIEGYPMTAQFLAGGGPDGQQGDGATDDVDDYDRGMDDSYPLGAQAHFERMARSRQSDGLIIGFDGRPIPPSTQPHAFSPERVHRSALKAELMSTLHAGLFGDLHPTPAQSYAGQHPSHEPANHFSFRNAETGERTFLADASGTGGIDHDDPLNSSELSMAPTQSTETENGFGNGADMNQQLMSYYPPPSVSSTHPSVDRLPPEHNSLVVPPAVLAHAVHHFAGRELHRQEIRMPKPAPSSSKSQAKQRQDRLIQRFFQDRVTREAEKEKERLELEEKERVAKEKEKKKKAIRAKKTIAAHRTDAERMRDAISGHNLSTLNEESGHNSTTSSSPQISAQNTGSGDRAGGFTLNVLPPTQDDGHSPATTTLQSLANDPSSDFNNLDYLTGGVSEGESNSPSKPNHRLEEEKVQPTHRVTGSTAPIVGHKSQSLSQSKPKPKKKVDISRLEMLYFKHRLTEQKKMALRAEKAQAELSQCTFQPNLKRVEIKGKVSGRLSRNLDEGHKKEEEAQTKQTRLDQLYRSHQNTQAKIAQMRVEAERARIEAERSHPFKPIVHPHRPVASTVALANSTYVKGFDEKVDMLRKGAIESHARGGSFEKWGLRLNEFGSVGSMSGSHMSESTSPHRPSPNHERHYTHAGEQVLLNTTSAEPIPQIIMRGTPGSQAPFQMISGVNPLSPTSQFSPGSNVASFVQYGEELDETLRRLDGRSTKSVTNPLESDGTTVSDLEDETGLIGRGTVEGNLPKVTPTGEAALTFAAASNPHGLGLGIVLPNNTPGSVIPRELTVYDKVSSYSYQYAKSQILDTHLHGSPSSSDSHRTPLKNRSGSSTPSRHHLPIPSPASLNSSTANSNLFSSPSAPAPLHASTPARTNQPVQEFNANNTNTSTVQSANQQSMTSPTAATSSPITKENEPITSTMHEASHGSASIPPPTATSSSAHFIHSSTPSSSYPLTDESTHLSSSSPTAASAIDHTTLTSNDSDRHDHSHDDNHAHAHADHVDDGSTSSVVNDDSSVPPADSDDSDSNRTVGDVDSSVHPDALPSIGIQLGGRTELILIQRGDDTTKLATEFTHTHGLDTPYIRVIAEMLDKHMAQYS